MAVVEMWPSCGGFQSEEDLSEYIGCWDKKIRPLWRGDR